MIALIDGHPDLSDWCFLIAAILFVVLAFLLGTSDATRTVATARGTALGFVGFALIAVGLLVL